MKTAPKELSKEQIETIRSEFSADYDLYLRFGDTGEDGMAGFYIEELTRHIAFLESNSPLDALEKLYAMYSDPKRASFDLVEIRKILKDAISKAKHGR